MSAIQCEGCGKPIKATSPLGLCPSCEKDEIDARREDENEYIAGYLGYE